MMSKESLDGYIEIDLRTACRICLKSNGSISIFSGIKSEDDYTLQERIMSFAYVEMSKDDGLPGQVCKMCFHKINKAFKLKAQCEYADMILRQYCRALNEEVEHTDAEILELHETQVPAGEENKPQDESSANNQTSILDENKPKVTDVEMTVPYQKEFSFKTAEKDIETICNSETADISHFLLNSDIPLIIINTTNKDIIIDSQGNPLPPCGEVNKLGSDVLSADGEIENDSQRKNEQKMMQLNEVNKQPVDKFPGDCSIGRNKSGESVEEPFKCSLCDRRFKLEGSLANHLSKEHEPTGEFPCVDCGRVLVQEQLLEIHVKIHTAERPYCCSRCGKCFMQLGTLTSHERSHIKKKSFLCNHCGKLFRNNRMHYCRVAHENLERTHECPVCGKKFLRSNTLQTHQKRHRVVERFQCKTCLKPFYSGAELARHTNVHLGIKPFACTYPDCDHAFYTRGELNRHTRSDAHVDTDSETFFGFNCSKIGLSELAYIQPKILIGFPTETLSENFSLVFDGTVLMGTNNSQCVCGEECVPICPTGFLTELLSQLARDFELRVMKGKKIKGSKDLF